MGLLNFLKKKTSSNSPEGQPENKPESAPNFSQIDKERMLVSQVTTEDMTQFTNIPYQLNYPVHKSIPAGGHPFAYINLVATNQEIAKKELREINTYIEKSPSLSPIIPRKIKIPIEDIAFTEYSKYYGYSRIMCTPYTATGKTSKYPLFLSFMTRLDQDSDTTHGELYYGQNGSILKSEINFWRRNKGYFYTFKVVNKEFVLYKIKTTAQLNDKNLPTTIYTYV